MNIYRNLLILPVCQALSVSSTIVMVTIGGLIGATLAPSQSLATLPVSLTVVGTALGTVPASMIMQAVGRRLGFACAALFGASAATLAALAAMNQDFLLFCLGALCLGMNVAFVQQYRYAAAESVPLSMAPKAIAWVLIGAIGGAIIGPELVTRGHLWVANHPYVGTLFGISVLNVMSAGLLLFIKEPSPEIDTTTDQTPRPLLEIIRQPLYMVAVLGGITGYGVMTLIMTATPINMHLVDGHSLQDAASVIRAHVIAMYAPSLVSAYLIGTLGVKRMMLSGASIMLVCVIIALSGRALMHYWWALIMLGVGWNFLYVGGTSLLLQTYRQSERFKAQAVNEFSVFGISALASLLAGTLVHQFGWRTLLLAALPIVLILVLSVFAARRQFDRPEVSRDAKTS